MTDLSGVLADTWVKQSTGEKGFWHTLTATSAHVFSEIIQQEYDVRNILIIV